MIDLNQLPAPSVIEELEFEAIYARKLARFQSLYPDYSAALESDPVVKLLELSAYDELMLRARINDAARANLLRYAAETDLEHLAVFYGLEKLDGESDDRFRFRLQLHISGMSGMGTDDYYRARALGVGLWVRDATVKVGHQGALTIVVWLADDAPPDALAITTDTLTDKRRRMATDTLTVVAAQPRPLVIVGTAWRSDGTPSARVSEAEDALRLAITSEAGVGGRLAINWMVGRLALTGISNVLLDEPLHDVVCAENEYPVISMLTIRDGGIQ